MTDLPEEERKAFRRAFPPPFDDLGPAGLCTCDTYPLPIEDHGDECAVRALYEGWLAHREYSKQREEKLARELKEAEARELAVRRIVESNAEELRVSYRDAMNEKIAEIEQREEKLREALDNLTEGLSRVNYEGEAGDVEDVDNARNDAIAALAENGDSDNA